ncbi:isocitrate lyase/PEP mutase family protein [Salinispora arenicola]|uniref:Methylisocitrate lyase n=1 Tax=Salinispora arenicola TaxID=168697 RepID=A0A542XLQ6_SALAC|nr:oxaloacetate decarboxylase [Salinispora arenicola]TQL36720.1 methylisocitrate lyase [Salinispora arenicola]GIM87833.1 methylisocitrate lyase [Salinispora arenicola]
MKRTTRFKELLLSPEILLLPTVPDPLAAKIAKQVGFKAISCAGYANSAAYLGAPDVQLMTLSEMVDCAWRIADATDLPVHMDGDNGHGNVTNVIRSLKQFEKAGVASIFFEDQVSPKRCGHMSGKRVVPADEFVAKIKAAVDARNDPDLLIMARTDAVAVNGLDDAIERMHMYLEAGADYAFIEALPTVAEMKRITQEINAPTIANLVPGGKTPLLSAGELQDIGFSAVAYPTTLTYAYAKTTRDLLTHLLRTGSIADVQDRMIEFTEFNKLVGLEQIRAREEKYYAGVDLEGHTTPGANAYAAE